MWEDTNLLAGFRCNAIPLNPCKIEASRWPSDLRATIETPEEVRPEMQMETKILMSSQFEQWDEFDTLVSEVASQLPKALTEQGCYLNNNRKDRCSGAFRNTVCRQEGCSEVASYKEVMNFNNPERYPDLQSDFRFFLLRGLECLAKELSPSCSGYIGKGCIGTEEPVPINTQAVYPTSFFQQQGQRLPDVIIELQTPDTSGLLPRTGNPGSPASIYTDSIAGLDANLRLPCGLRSIARTVKSSLHTRSGYGCLVNHNEAVFVKVSPNSSEIREQKRVAHTVLVSREFKCDGDLSVFHGLLTLLIHGNMASNAATEKKLREYFRLLEATECSKAGGFLVSHSDEESSKQKLERERRAGNEGMDSTHEKEGLDSIENQKTAKRCKIEDEWGSDNDEDFLRLCPEASKDAQERVRQALEGGKVAILDEFEMIRMFITRSEFIALGGSGILSETWVGGVKMAVKRWHWGLHDGLAWLLKEIMVYKMLAKEHPEMLGSVVPRVIAICEEPFEESMLVTEFVGSGLSLVWPNKEKEEDDSEEESEKERPLWYVDGVKLSEVDQRCIEKSAAEGLRRLHGCGIMHRDARPINLRVERMTEKDGRTGWRTWWIDLGVVKLKDEKKFGDMSVVRLLNFEERRVSSSRWRERMPEFELGNEL